MTSLEALLEPIRHSPQLVRAVELLQQEIDAERAKREEFYRDMTPEQKVEFIYGETVMHSPAKNRHLVATQALSRLMNTFVDLTKTGCVRIEKCLCVFPRNDYEPDIVFFGSEKAAEFTEETMRFPIPDLVVEVLSPSTEARDRGVKFEDYAANGVCEYWIVDCEQAVVEQYVLAGEQFELRMKSATGTVVSEAIAGFEIPVVSIFDESENLSALKSLLAD